MDYSVLNCSRGKFTVYYGTKAKKFEKLIQPPKVINQFSGTVIFNGGKILGTAKIINSVSGLSKLEVGEILVSSMTRPEFLLAIKKAGAIITDEGGLLSHAAIISRELKIPCIVGTKIATRVLHDGNLVEVDADKGVVRIIKRK